MVGPWVADFFPTKKVYILVCSVPKAGSTTSKQTLALLNDGPVTPIHKINLMQYNHFYVDYKTVMFVRDPVEELLTSYCNKLTGDRRKGTLTKDVNAVKKMNRYDKSQMGLKFKEVTFREFMQCYVERSHNKHWETYQKLCQPCKIHYDIISR